MNILVERWAFHSPEASAVTVLPDGCRDVILKAQSGRRPALNISPLDRAPKQHHLASNTRFMGFRLRPGAIINQPALVRWWQYAAPETLDIQTLAEFVHICRRTDEVLQALAVAQSPARAAHDLGIGMRTLQRVLHRARLPAPDFWRQLARARRAALALTHPVALIETALSCGYADQAHLTRACRRWFGLTPGQLRAHPDLLKSATAPGYA